MSCDYTQYQQKFNKGQTQDDVPIWKRKERSEGIVKLTLSERKTSSSCFATELQASDKPRLVANMKLGIFQPYQCSNKKLTLSEELRHAACKISQKAGAIYEVTHTQQRG